MENSYWTTRVPFLPPANEVWGRVIFLHLFVILFTGEGAWSQGGPGPGGVPAPRGEVPGWGVCSQGGCLVSGGCLLPGGAWSLGGCLVLGGAWWRPPDGYCCGWYASYWNAFLLCKILLLVRICQDLDSTELTWIFDIYSRVLCKNSLYFLLYLSYNFSHVEINL